MQFGFGEIHHARQPPENFRIGQRLADRLRGLDLRRKRQMEIACHDVVEFKEARGRQHEIGKIRRVGPEEIRNHGEEVFARKRLAQDSTPRY